MQSGVLYLRIHQAQRQTDGDTENPHKADLQGHSLLGLVTSKLHRVAQTQVTIYAYSAQVHNARRAE